MPTIRMSYGTVTSMTITLASLANNTSVTSSSVTNAVNLFTDALVEVIIATGTGTAATGYCEVFVKGSIDNSDFATDTGDRKVATIATPTASTTYKTVINVAPAFAGMMPQYWQIRVRNVSGAALAASGSSAAYSGVLLTST